MSSSPCVCASVHGLLWKLPTKTVARNRRRKHSTSTSAHKTDICSEIHSQQSSESHFQINTTPSTKKMTKNITSQSHLLWFISASPPLFFPGPQLWRRRGDSERWLFRRRQERCGTSVTLSLASSSASPPPPPPPPPLSSPAVIAAPMWMPSTGLQMHSRPWLPSRLELDGQTLAVSSVEEQETETSLVLSPPVTGSSFCRQECM